MQNKQIIIKGLRINYLQSELFNTNECALFLPGWNSKAEIFCNAVKPKSSFIAINLPGTGGSDSPKEAWKINDYADFINEFVQRLEIVNPIIIGHSFGGGLAVKYQVQFTNSRKLILIAPAIIRRKGPKVLLFYFLSKMISLLFPFLKKYLQSIFYRNNPTDYSQAGGMKEVFKNVINEDLSLEFLSLKIPVVCVCGSHDDAVPIKDLKNLVSKNKYASYQNIDSAGHYCFLDQPENFKQIFLTELCC